MINDKCVCGHELNHHVRGPIEDFYTPRYHSQPRENRLNCKDCDCPKYRKKQFFWWNKFWNGYKENEN